MVLPLCGSGSGLNFMLLLYLRTTRPIESSYFYYVTTYIRTGPYTWKLAVGHWLLEIRPFFWSLDIPCWILDIHPPAPIDHRLLRL